MSLVSGTGGGEKVKIDGEYVRKRMNLTSTITRDLMAQTSGTITKVFKLKNELYICVGAGLYKFNEDTRQLTFLTNAPDPYFLFCNDEKIFCGRYLYQDSPSYRIYLSIHEYDANTNSFVLKSEQAKTQVEPGIAPTFFGYGTKAGGMVRYSPKWQTEKSTLIIGDIYTLDFDLDNNTNYSTKMRCMALNGKNYINLTANPLDAGNKRFTMYENTTRHEYVASDDFLDTYDDGSLAVVDGKLYMYGTNSKGVTKRIEWTGTTYENEEVLYKENSGVNINDTGILQGKSIIYAGQGNSIFKINKGFIEI